MHLERDILKGKFGRNKQLKKEAVEELEENESNPKAKALLKKIGKCKSCGKGKCNCK